MLDSGLNALGATRGGMPPILLSASDCAKSCSYRSAELTQTPTG